MTADVWDAALVKLMAPMGSRAKPGDLSDLFVLKSAGQGSRRSSASPSTNLRAPPTYDRPMLIEIWSDVVCPWCYIGKRRFEHGLDAFRHAGGDADVEVVWRSFQLNPDQPRDAVTTLEASLMAKTGGSAEQVRAMNQHVTALAAAEGLDYHLDRYRVVNTFDAHRVLQMAKANGLGTAAHERLLHAQLVDGELLEDRATLVRLAGEMGLAASAATDMLAGDDFRQDVLADLRDAAELGISAVPFFVFNRTYGVAGAQPAEVFTQVLTQVAAETAMSAPTDEAPGV